MINSINKKTPMTAPMMAGGFKLVFELMLPPDAMLSVATAVAEAGELNENPKIQ
jgi:hypothetical protein